MKKILFVASESVPFIKTGGLADVVGSLPKYFNKDEFDVRVMLPKYTSIPDEYKNQMEFLTHFYLELAWRKQYVGVLQMNYQGVIFYFLDNEFYFSGEKPYGEIYQDIEKFAFFDKAALSTLPLIDSGRTLSTAMTGRPGFCRFICRILSSRAIFIEESRAL